MEKDQSKGAVEELIALEAVRNVLHIQWHSLFQAIFILAQVFFGSESFGILIGSNWPGLIFNLFCMFFALQTVRK